MTHHSATCTKLCMYCVNVFAAFHRWRHDTAVMYEYKTLLTNFGVSCHNCVKKVKKKCVLVLSYLSITPWKRMGSDYTDPRFLHLGTSWRCDQLHDPAELLSGRDSCNHWIGDWVGSRAGMDDSSGNSWSSPRTELQGTAERGGEGDLYEFSTLNVISAVTEVRRPVVGGSSRTFRRNVLPNCRLCVVCFAYSTMKSKAVRYSENIDKLLPDYTIPHPTRADSHAFCTQNNSTSYVCTGPCPLRRVQLTWTVPKSSGAILRETSSWEATYQVFRCAYLSLQHLIQHVTHNVLRKKPCSSFSMVCWRSQQT
jgi:hypothetical protein